MIEFLREWTQKAHAFEEEARRFLAKHESSRDRTITLDDTLKKLSGLSLKQDELFKQAITCIERGIFRAAHVMAWAAFVDFLEMKLDSDGFAKVKNIKTGWQQYQSLEDIRENVPEYQLIEAAKEVRLITKQQMKALHGLLSTRNECAHPSSYNPGLSESLGYVANLLNRIAAIQKKPYP